MRTNKSFQASLWRFFVVLTGSFIAANQTFAAEPRVDFNRDIRTLLFGKCVTCHGPDEEERAADLRLDNAEGAHDYAIVPGDADASELIARIVTDDDDIRMPPPGKGKPFTPDEVELIRRWINQGGEYARHWSYEKPTRPEQPPVKQTDWPANAIDRFTLSTIESQGLRPSPPADRLTIARRVAIDLTGLPPTWDQAQSFANDPSANAYEAYVDSLLANPSFGERWARVWLDLARYADSAGYADDPPRTIWAYRDYVIRAINNNMPFDQFTIEQIAGDLLPHPTPQQLIATAFHRNTLTNNEGGTNDEEFRNAAVVDRVNTTMAVWMGTTMACAQCHTHKYDPITHEDYFSLFALFNQTADRDVRDESPLFDIWSDEQRRLKAEWRQQIATLSKTLEKSSPELEQQRERWIRSFDSSPHWSVCQGTPDADESRLTIDQDGWVHANHASDEAQFEPRNDRYRVKWNPDAEPITALQLQIPASQTDNFVVTHISATFVPETRTATRARFVRIELPGKSKHLHLAEMQVFSDGKNIAIDGNATQISTYSDAVASRVNDGNTDGDYASGSVQHALQADNPWVEIDLLDQKLIDQVVVWNRTDGDESIKTRLNGFVVQLLNQERQVIASMSHKGDAGTTHQFDFTGTRDLVFVSATADFEQQNFPAKSTLAKLTPAKLTPTHPSDAAKGWAVSPQQGQPHELTLTLAQPLPAVPGMLILELEQASVHEQHLLQHFRVRASTDPNAIRWAGLPNSIREVFTRPRDQWNDSQLATVDAYFRTIAPQLKKIRDQRDRLIARQDAMKPETTVPVMQELPETKHRVTKIQIRGNYLSTGDTVHAGTPKAFHPLKHTKQPNRLDLAHWLVSPDNPLTARVIANRHWEQLFGTGIVETSEEFGSQGEPPSHPELLDWLAMELQESQWDLKHLIKLIVMSSTYRQSSVTSTEAVQSDPNNRMLARGPRFRVSAEMVRDQALFVGGLLSEKRFGKPVNPPQPSLGLKAAFGGKTDWTTSDGEDRYRRGLYTMWRRSSPYPSMAQFDAPNREVCTVRRIRTNTPLQALVTLNDPVYIEAAQSLARQMIATSDDPASRIKHAFQTCLIRPPTKAETQRLLDLAEQAESFYDGDLQEATKMATDPLGPLDDKQNERVAQFAAWTTIANVILNLDEMFLKR